MLRAWRGRLFHVLFIAQAVALVLALQLGGTRAWTLALALAAPLNLFGWLRARRIARAIEDTPASRVATAAQGYVELHGHARPHEGVELVTPHSQLPCVWYRYLVERREGDEWRHLDSAESEAPFDLEDGSGRCAVHPAGAHIETTHKEVRRQDDLRHTEWVLLKGDRLYALGAFDSLRPEQLALNARVEEGELLAEWKQDQAELHRRFDLDGDGAISPKEWMLARQAARREVARRHAQLRAESARHMLSRPGDGRPYLISNLPPDKLGRRHAWLARLFMALLLGYLGVITYLLKTGG
jgi:hypothetical protein